MKEGLAVVLTSLPVSIKREGRWVEGELEAARAWPHGH